MISCIEFCLFRESDPTIVRDAYSWMAASSKYQRLIFRMSPNLEQSVLNLDMFWSIIAW